MPPVSLDETPYTPAQPPTSNPNADYQEGKLEPHHVYGLRANQGQSVSTAGFVVIGAGVSCSQAGRRRFPEIFQGFTGLLIATAGCLRSSQRETRMHGGIAHLAEIYPRCFCQPRQPSRSAFASSPRDPEIRPGLIANEQRDPLGVARRPLSRSLTQLGPAQHVVRPSAAFSGTCLAGPTTSFPTSCTARSPAIRSARPVRATLGLAV